jgi:hypothetical protein
MVGYAFRNAVHGALVNMNADSHARRECRAGEPLQIGDGFLRRGEVTVAVDFARGILLHHMEESDRRSEP